MAEMIVEHPEQFGLGFLKGENDTCGRRPLRILELGAAAKVLVASSTKRDCRATVVAADLYPSVLDNLRANIDKNFPGDPSGGVVTTTSHFLDWSKLPATPSVPELLSELFDVIFGADIVYETDHAIWVKVFRAASTPSEHITSFSPRRYLPSNDTPQANAHVRS